MVSGACLNRADNEYVYVQCMQVFTTLFIVPSISTFKRPPLELKLRPLET